MFLDEQDVTSQFRHDARLVMGDGVIGLQPVYYTVELSQDVVADDWYDEKTLSCRASLAADDVPQSLNASLIHKNADLVINVHCQSLLSIQQCSFSSL